MSIDLNSSTISSHFRPKFLRRDMSFAALFFMYSEQFHRAAHLQLEFVGSELARHVPQNAVSITCAMFRGKGTTLRPHMAKSLKCIER